jgi:hypothetical protein
MVLQMEIDPIDDGPRENPDPPIAAIPPPLQLLNHPTVVMPVTNAEDATAAIERLRSDDYSQRVLASHQLDSIARILGPERTKTVRNEKHGWLLLCLVLVFVGGCDALVH